jgi:hypothetical protein
MVDAKRGVVRHVRTNTGLGSRDYHYPVRFAGQPVYPRLGEISRTREHLRKILALVGVSTVAGLLIMGLIKTLQRK